MYRPVMRMSTLALHPVVPVAADAATLITEIQAAERALDELKVLEDSADPPFQQGVGVSERYGPAN